MRRLLFFLLFVSSLTFGYLLNQAGRARDVYQSVCDLVEQHFYRDDLHLDDWVSECHRRAALLPGFARSDTVLTDMQDLMNKMGVSHFKVYSPAEDRLLWTGESIDTGIRSRYVEDHLVVYRVVPDSAGAVAGVRAGDEILRISGTDQVTPWGAQHRSGHFLLQRRNQQLKVKLESRPLTPDYSPLLTKVTQATGVLEIPSFRSEFFARDRWMELVRKMRPYQHMIIDLRENSGGNFVAMLRALSPFMCGRKFIGQLTQPRKKLPLKKEFDDNTDDRYQIDELDKYRDLGLWTFSNYGCFKGRVTVLISPETSSVAEIFADSFFYRAASRVWGQPSAGDVVLAVWYDLPLLGAGHSVSIPEAVYLNHQDKELEGQGIWPQRELFYELTSSLRGIDSWVEKAAHQ